MSRHFLSHQLTLMCGMLTVTLSLALTLSACHVSVPPRPVTECLPKPEPQCMPKACLDKAKDTIDRGDGQDYYVVHDVAGLNGPDAEWSLCWTSASDAFLSSGSPGTMHLNAVRFSSYDTAQLAKRYAVDPDKAQGAGLLCSSQPAICAVYRFDDRDTVAHLYQSKLRDDGIIEIADLPSADAMPAWNSHPAVTPDRQLLFFASNREGGYGGSDIWYMWRNGSGAWSQAINAGPVINTPCDELCPYVSQDAKSFFFASTGHEGFGGYDIFRSNLVVGASTKNVRFDSARNVGQPLNSAADELFASSPASPDDLLYFSSNRRHSTGFDIYVQQRRRSRRATTPPVVPQQTPSVTVKDEPVTPADSITIRGRIRTTRRVIVRHAEIVAREIHQRRVVGRTFSNDSGDYEMRVPLLHDIEVTAQSEDGFFDSYKITKAPRDPLVEYVHNFEVPDVMLLRINFPENISQEPYKTVLDSNGSETAQLWTEQIDLVANNIRTYQDNIRQVVLVGHTDENGTNEYNFALGKRRVDFVVDELVKRGLPRKLFVTRSAGELEPLARRKDEALETYYKRNRRVELSKVMR